MANAQGQNKSYTEEIPAGLRFCPLKRRKKKMAIQDKLCDKERCAFWNDRRGRCGYIR